MLGNILIDKLQCYFLLKDKGQEYAFGLKKHIETTLSKHYAKNSYMVWLSQKGRMLHFWFTPTRYYNSILELKNYTDTNLDMPAEIHIKDLFYELFLNKNLLELRSTCRITILDLTKNFFMNKKIYYYLEAFLNYKYFNGFKVKSINSGCYTKTITISAVAKDLTKKDTVGDRELKCYDKVEELKTHHLSEIILKNTLSDEECKIPAIKQNYEKSTNTLRLNGLNILRLEWHLKSSKKLCEISKFFGFEHTNYLYLKDFLNLLDKCELYEMLDKFYTDYTLKIFKTTSPKQKRKPNVYLQILVDYNGLDIAQKLESVFKENNMHNKYKKMLSYLQETNENEYIKEILDNIKAQNNI